jgi:hypothetical protein
MMSGRYDPVPDLAALLAGLQVPRSMLDGQGLGGGLEPFDRLRAGLDLFGYPDAAEHEERLRRALGPPEPGPPAETCPGCSEPRVQGRIAHRLSCPDIWRVT